MNYYLTLCKANTVFWGLLFTSLLWCNFLNNRKTYCNSSYIFKVFVF
jgi:hypothetical protein